VPAAVPVALLYQAGDLGGHLKTALNELGAAIVYESQASNLDRVALEGSGARIVVFNLDPESESEIDHVYDVLDDGDYEVVFNDADVSASLSGWDQARWARNLAAKILHRPEIATPARPAWAESVPARGAVIAPQPAVATSAETGPVAVEMPAPVAPPAEVAAAEPVPPVAATPEPAEQPIYEVAAPEPAEQPMYEVAAPEPAPAAADAPTLELPILEGFNLEEIDIDLDSLQAPAPVAPSNDFASALDDFAAQVPTHRYESGSADEFASQLDAMFTDARGGAPAPSEAAAESPLDDVTFDAGDSPIEAVDFPGIFESAASSVPEAADRTYKPAPRPERAQSPVASEDDKPVNPLLPPEWSLEPLDDAPAAPPARPLEKSSAFGIETMSATEFLEPEDATLHVTPVTPAGDAFSLELMPMEEAVAPEAYADAATLASASAEGAVPAARFQLGSAAKLRRVVVLGASFGGPEAVREILAALPPQFPALCELAQHMGDEYRELMTMQLAKAVRLTVRTPTHGEHVGHGEVVIVPTRQRMQIDSEGVITLSPLIERTAYSPSIDQVLRDVADEFAAKASAIIFSGMAQDAIEGSKYLSARGGTVWAQDPDSCTISTMVDSVRQTGTVAFVGSPAQLAAKMLAETQG
jgi:two-component system chemotaxis response regulator CheB/chemosensory pili system protein ChpB (putative protein-glutamate methylesterase)